MIDTVESVLLKTFGQKDGAFIQGVLGAPGDQHILNEYKEWLQTRSDARGEYLSLLAEAQTKPVGSTDLKRLYEKINQIKPTLHPLWLLLVHPNMAIPRDLSSRGREAADVYLAIFLVPPPTSYDWRVFYSPQEWRTARRPCPQLTLLITLMAREWLGRNKISMLTQALEERGFAVSPCDDTADAILDKTLSANEDGIRVTVEAKEKDNCFDQMSWREMKKVLANRKEGITGSYTEVEFLDWNESDGPSPLGTRSLKILSSWPGYPYVLSIISDKLPGFTFVQADLLPSDGQEVVVWQRS